MRRLTRNLGTLLIASGIAVLAWAALVWAWQDPFTSFYTRWEQHKLAQRYDRLAAAFEPQVQRGASLATATRALRAEARAFRRQAKRGDAIGRIRIPRMGVDMILVNGTDHDSLTKGPGRDLRTFMPGQGELVYVAGHRTTYLAPFSHIDSLRPGDGVTIEVPYATLVYAVTGHRIVNAGDLSVLKSPGHELLELQACHPRFFASQRYIAYARLVSARLRGTSTSVSPAALATAARA
jgi:sortase A